eukprot:g231.t1
MSRLNSVWARSNKTKMFEERELDAEELKKGLINDPEELVRWEVEEQLSDLKSQLVVNEANLKELKEASSIQKNYSDQMLLLDNYLKELRQDPRVKYGTEPDKIAALQKMPGTDLKDIYKVLGRYAKLMPDYSRYRLKDALDRHKKYGKRIENIERKILQREGLTIDDDFLPLIRQYADRVEEIKVKMADVRSDENMQRLLERVLEDKEKEEANKKPVSERVNEFQRLNYLLDCHHKVHSCDIYGRVEELASGKAVAAVKQPQRVLETTKAFRYRWPKALKTFMPKAQQAAVRDVLRESENPEAYAKTVLDPLQKQVESIPKLYATESVPLNEKIIYAHFFQGSSDWYIAEYDPKENMAFGYTILNGDTEMAEWGYISIAELSSVKIIELDFYWQPQPFAEVVKVPTPSSPSAAPAQAITEAIEALKIAAEFAPGNDKKELSSAIEALEVALEFA